MPHSVPSNFVFNVENLGSSEVVTCAGQTLIILFPIGLLLLWAPRAF